MPDGIVPDFDAKRTYAVSYLARGWKVFVLGAGKTPLPNCSACHTAGPAHDREACFCLTCHGFYAATDDVERVELMLMTHPDGLLAVRTGAPSGIVVIDAEADGDPSGLDVVDAWETWTGGTTLPDTLRSRSGGGGVHSFFAYEPGIRSRNRVLPSVDIKSDGGYVAVPCGGSDRIWLNESPVAELPPETARWLLTSRGGGRGHAGTPGFTEGYDYDAFVRDGCPGGHRDEFFNDMCFRLRKAGASEDDARTELRKHWERAAQPPRARYDMPWEHVLYKLERVWRTVEADAPTPEWRPATVVTSEPATVENASDTGNALRFIRLCDGNVRYITELRRWLLWNGNRWVPDRVNRVASFTAQVAEDIRRFADAQQDHDERRTWGRWALASESHRARQALLAIASSDSRVALTVDVLDADPLKLVTHGGTLDLVTGELVASQRDDLCVRTANVTVDVEATCPRWRDHIRLITHADPSLAAYLRRAVGYTLTGLVSEQTFFMLEGDGNNGKNAFIEPIIALLGDYAQTGTSALITGGDEQHPTILADLVGARAVFVDEARQGRPLNVERVKQLTGSRRIKARRMGMDFFEFDARLKLWIAGNNHPTMRDPSNGVWRRLHRILFTHKFDEQMKIKDYGAILFAEEAPGILNWALEGLRDWQHLGGLGQPPSVDTAVAELREDEDFVGQFLAERCIVTMSADDRASTAELFVEFSIWATLAGIPQHDRPNRTQFGRQLSSRGLERWQSSVDGVKTRGFTGVRVWRAAG